MIKRVAIVLLLLATLSARAAHADCDAARLADVEARLHAEAHRLAVWKWSWGLSLTGAAAVQFALIPVFDKRDTTIDMIAGGGSSLVGAISTAFFSPSVEDSELGPSASVCDRLADADRRLARAVADEHAGTSFWLHALNVAFNLGVGVVLGAGYGHWTSGVIKFATGTAVGEAIILTQPVGVVPGPGVGLALRISF